MHVRLGRLVLRSHPSYVTWLPSGYRYKPPQLLYLVEAIDDRDHHTSQLAAFTTVAGAKACIATLESDDWRDLHINLVPVHERLTDWQWDR